jgi:hypothetical protein
VLSGKVVYLALEKRVLAFQEGTIWKEAVSMRQMAYKLILVCLFFTGCASSPHPHQEELKAAYERYLRTIQEAELTLDTSRLSEVVTGELLESTVAGIERQKADFPKLISNDFEIVSFRVLDYNPPRATIEVGENYRYFNQNAITGERDYGPSPDRWICHLFRVTLVQEEGTWKVLSLDDVIEWGPCDAPKNWTPPARAAPTIQTKGTPLPE